MERTLCADAWSPLSWPYFCCCSSSASSMAIIAPTTLMAVKAKATLPTTVAKPGLRWGTCPTPAWITSQGSRRPNRFSTPSFNMISVDQVRACRRSRRSVGANAHTTSRRAAKAASSSPVRPMVACIQGSSWWRESNRAKEFNGKRQTFSMGKMRQLLCHPTAAAKAKTLSEPVAAGEFRQSERAAARSAMSAGDVR